MAVAALSVSCCVAPGPAARGCPSSWASTPASPRSSGRARCGGTRGWVRQWPGRHPCRRRGRDVGSDQVASGEVASLSQRTDPFRNVIVPLDGTVNAERALGCARPLATATGGEMILVGSTSHDGDYPDLAEYLDVDRFGAARREILVRVGAARAIDTVARRWAPSLVCMASHEHSSRAAAVLGSVTEQLLAQGAAPVLVVGPSVEWPANTRCDSVLACMNDSPDSIPAATAATELSTALQVPCHVVSVVSGPDKAQPRRDIIRRHLEFLDVEADVEILESDDVVSALVDRTAPPGSILAIATRGPTRTHTLISGSVALDVVGRAANPVLVVPQHRAARSWRDWSLLSH